MDDFRAAVIELHEIFILDEAVC